MEGGGFTRILDLAGWWRCGTERGEELEIGSTLGLEKQEKVGWHARRKSSGGQQATEEVGRRWTHTFPTLQPRGTTGGEWGRWRHLLLSPGSSGPSRRGGEGGGPKQHRRCPSSRASWSHRGADALVIHGGLGLHPAVPYGAGGVIAQHAPQHGSPGPLELVPELLAHHDVDDGVDAAVDVGDAGHDGVSFLGTLESFAVRRGGGQDQPHDVVGQPAHEEADDDH